MKIYNLSNLTLVLSLSVGIQAAALADGVLGGIIKDTLHVAGTTVEGGTRIVAGTVDATGNVVDASGKLIGRVVHSGEATRSAPTDTVMMLGTTSDILGYSIDTRRYDLSRAIDTAESRDLIRRDQSAELRSRLDAITARQSNTQKQRDLTFDDSLALALELDAINNQLAGAIKDQPFESLVMTDSSGHQRLYVTTPQPMSGRTRLTESRTTSSNGITQTTTTTTSSATISGSPSNTAILSVLDARRFQLEGRVSDAIDRRALAADKLEQMQNDLSKLRAELVLMQSSSATMTSGQALALARQLDAMDTNVAKSLQVNAWTPLTVVDAGTGNAQIVTDQFMNVIGLRDAGPELYIDSLEARKRELGDYIAKQELAGTLSKSQAQDLLIELDRAGKLTSERNSIHGPAEALPIAVSLDYVGNQIRAMVPTYGYIPLINDSRFVVVGGRVILIDDLMVRRAGLQSRIAREFAAGRISAGENDALRTQMISLATDEGLMRGKGEMTFIDSRVLYQGFDKVASRLDGYIDSSKRPPVSNR